MKGRGANVVGDSTKLFGAGKSAQAAEFLIGGRISNISGKIFHISGFFRRPQLTGESFGKFSITVEWELYSPLTRRVVYKFSTQGHGDNRRASRNGVTQAYRNALVNAVETAAEDRGLKKALTRKTETTVSAQPSLERITVTGRGLYRKPIESHVGTVRLAAVTIELGGSHGSGFLISRDGYVLTNAHVVGEGKYVPVVFTNGLRVNGRVLRVANKRDVALVKVPIIADHILPVAQKITLKVSDTVYALGTPLVTSLKASLTKGIVSAYRNLDGDLHIQADVAVTGGNSGGPLLDRKGNVVGITVAKIRGGENLNLFIPIDEALKSLNLNIEVE